LYREGSDVTGSTGELRCRKIETSRNATAQRNRAGTHFADFIPAEWAWVNELAKAH